MKALALIFTLGIVLPGALSANSLSCGFTLTSLSGAGCVTMSSFSFNDSVLWTSAGSAWEGPGEPNSEPVNGGGSDPANSASYTGTSTGGVSVTATTAPGGSGTLLGRYDEAPWVWAGPVVGWTQPGATNCTAYSFNGSNFVCSSSASTPYLLTSNGHFTFDTSTAIVYGAGSVDANTALLGTTGDGTGPIQLSFSQSLNDFGVDISALNAVNFTATLQAYDGSTLVGTYYVVANGYGGVCYSLTSPASGGHGCNDAPFIGIGNLGPITKIVLGVTDNSTGNPTAFAIDTLQLGGEAITTPEPSMMLLAAFGLGGLLWRRRKSSANVR